MASLAAFILTYNESVHIERCIRSLLPIARQVFLVDSGSTDSTVAIAERLGARVFQHTWENHHARQTNWAIDHLPIETDWVMRVDADEIVTPELAAEIEAELDGLAPEITGLVLRRRQVFLGRTLRWGDNYPVRLLRIWRRGEARCEDRWMDEHMITSGSTRELRHDLEDRNLNDLRWWTHKQANYAVREAADILLRTESADAEADPALRAKRQLKSAYRQLPPFVRPVAYFSYRYFVRLGFLDGAPGAIWHVLQGFWYRFLVDAIIHEVRVVSERTGASRAEILRDLYGLRIRDP
jgi:glycosyltransferase involved in cell wall biosynthesis